MKKLLNDFGVRALEATIVVGGATFGGVWLVTHSKEELGMGFLSAAAMAAIGFYFGSRNAQPPSSPP